MIRTSLINGVINLDSDFSKYIESLSNPGVIEGFNVQDGVVKPGKARVKAERTNGETIYCYVENTEDVSLSGNDGKVYIVIDQEDIDSGLVSEDGSNIARIEEGEVRPVKNFLKIWSKNGGLIVDEREMVKKINEVDEDLEEEISGIDTRLTEAEHDIQQIIEQSGSALSYLDKTCYAGEEIHENDLIVTNGNSFNPDFTDENLSVGGTTINKYAIGFIGNGETTDTFSIKTSVIQGFEPDSITINLETDDNGKPSGTVLATNTDLDNFKANNDLMNNPTTSAISSGLNHRYMNSLGADEGNIAWNTSSRIMTISGTVYNYTLDLSSLILLGNQLLFKAKDDKHFLFGRTGSKDNVQLLYLPNVFNTDGATVQNLNDATGFKNIGISDDGKYLFGSGSSQSILTVHTLAENFVLNNISSSKELTLTRDMIRNWDCPLKSVIFNNKHYLFYSGAGANQQHLSILEFDDNCEIVNYVNTGYLGARENIFPDYRTENTRFYGSSVEIIPGLGRNYNSIVNKITFGTPVSTTNRTKYWLTIAPVRSGSVVDNMNIFDKEGNYYSELAVRDLNEWSNVSGKTPFIDATCIKARYARKVKENDSLETVPCGFANGDFTELESVQYTFQGLKTGFSGLTTDSLYYSDGNGGITRTIGQYVVGKSTDSNSLLVQFTPFVQIIAGKQYTLKSGTGSFTVEQTGDYLIEMHWGGSNNRDSGVKITNSSDETIYTASTNNDSRVYRFTSGTYTVTRTGDWMYAGTLTSNITYTKIPYNS